MPSDLVELISGLPFAASLAFAVAVGELRRGRRRRALNESLHELRRPLQRLALAAPARAEAVDDSLRTIGDALDRLDREINGGLAPRTLGRFSARPLLEQVVGRWRRGGEDDDPVLRWEGPPVELDGDRDEVERALDNLIANAREHGGAPVAITALPVGDRLRLAVVDRGSSGPGGRRAGPAAVIEQLTGRRRRGHGLRIVRRVAAAHGGSFELRRDGSETEAVLELPLAGGTGAS
jgi:two-component system osmolarity sensor histidine kinase EnvZ